MDSALQAVHARKTLASTVFRRYFQVLPSAPAHGLRPGMVFPSRGVEVTSPLLLMIAGDGTPCTLALKSDLERIMRRDVPDLGAIAAPTDLHNCVVVHAVRSKKNSGELARAGTYVVVLRPGDETKT